MSPAAQLVAVAAITFAALGFTVVALALLAATIALGLWGFIVPALASEAGPPEPEEAAPAPGVSPEEALREAAAARRDAIDPEGEAARVDG